MPFYVRGLAVFINKSGGLAAIFAGPSALIEKTADYLNLAADGTVEGDVVASPIFKVPEVGFVQFSMVHYALRKSTRCRDSERGRGKPRPYGVRKGYDAFLAWGGAAALALATRLVKAAASFTAMSARILRSRETPAAFRPWISWP